MYKTVIAIVAITLVTAATGSAPFSTEARSDSDVRSTLADLYQDSAEIQSYTRNSYIGRDSRALIPTGSKRISRLTISPPANDASSVPDEVPVSRTEAKTSVHNPSRIGESVMTGAVGSEDNESIPEVITEETQTESSVIEEATHPDEVVNVSAADFLSELADEIHRLTNLERTRAGVSPLGYDAALAVIAKQYSADMAQKDYFSHIAPNGCDLACRFTQADYSASAWGENIAWYRSSNLPDAAELAAFFVGGWMDSDGHRRNILSNNFTHEGVGLAQIGDKVYATANFAKPR